MEISVETSGQNATNMAKSHNRFRKVNKNRKFSKNAKGFAKLGVYGRGTHIDEGDFTYFINILDSMKGGFESIEEKVTMANNVFEQTIGKEVQLASNQVVSKAIENLIGFVDARHFERFIDEVSKTLRSICSDPFASHVLQKMIKIAFLRSFDADDSKKENKKRKLDEICEKTFNRETNFPTEHRNICSSFIVKIGKFLLNNLEDFIWDVYGTHIMRSIVLALSGSYDSKIAFMENVDKVKYDQSFELRDEWTEIVKEYINRLQMWPQFDELPYNELSSGLLQKLCIGISKIDRSTLKHFGKKILSVSFLRPLVEDDSKKIDVDEQNHVNTKEAKNKDDNGVKLPKVFHKKASIRLLETLITVAGPKLFTQIYAMLFVGRIAILSLDRATNFSVQKLIEFVVEKSEFENIFDEIVDSFEDILKVGHSGILVVLSTTCIRLQTRQAAFVAALQKALHATGSKERFDALVKCTLKLMPYEHIYGDQSNNVNLHGSIILQNMLKFNKPIKLVQYLIETPANELVAIFNTPNGSFIVDAFIESKFIGEKSREKFIRHLYGNYIDMALTKFGSRVLEKLFNAATDSDQARIVKELSEKSNQLNSTPFGRIISSKFRVETYKLTPTQWKAAFNKANKAEKLFNDIVN